MGLSKGEKRGLFRQANGKCLYRRVSRLAVVRCRLIWGGVSVDAKRAEEGPGFLLHREQEKGGSAVAEAATRTREAARGGRASVGWGFA